MYKTFVLVVVSLALGWSYAYPKDLDNKYAASPNREWFRSLKPYSNSPPCCDEADGIAVDGDDYEVRNGHYWVRLKGEWREIREDQLVTEPNRLGTAFVWTYTNGMNIYIRCFMPGGGM